MASADFSQFVVTMARLPAAHCCNRDSGFFLARATCETSPGTHTFFHSYTRHVYRKRFRAAFGLWLVWQPYPRSRPNMIPVRRARVLPLPSFRFHLTTDTLGFGYDLPAAGRSRVFHPLERALAGRTRIQALTEKSLSRQRLSILIFRMIEAAALNAPCRSPSAACTRCSPVCPDIPAAFQTCPAGTDPWSSPFSYIRRNSCSAGAPPGGSSPVDG